MMHDLAPRLYLFIDGSRKTAIGGEMETKLIIWMIWKIYMMKNIEKR